MKISQTFMKVMRSYKAGEECGNIVRHMFVDGKLLPPTEAQALGSYFEYHAIGNLPKDKQIPQAKNKQKGEGAYANYRKAMAAALYVQGLLARMGLKIIKKGWHVTKGRFHGTLDMVVEATKPITFREGMVWKKCYRCVIDMKYSGLLYNRWSKFGWMMTDEQKEYHGTQGIQYHMLTGLDFYFWVTSSQNTEEDNGYPMPDMKLIPVKVTKETMAKHIDEGNALMKNFNFQKTIGFVARPEFNKCQTCPLASQCEDKHEFPHPQEVVEV